MVSLRDQQMARRASSGRRSQPHLRAGTYNAPHTQGYTGYRMAYRSHYAPGTQGYKGYPQRAGKSPPPPAGGLRPAFPFSSPPPPLPKGIPNALSRGGQLRLGPPGAPLPRRGYSQAEMSCL